MKKIIIFAIVLVFLLAIPFAAMAERYGVVVNPSHEQVLGGHSTHAVNGLAKAAGPSPAVAIVKGK